MQREAFITGRREISIVVIDRLPIVRLGLASFLNAEPGWKVVGVAGDAAQGIKHVQQQQPAIAVIDINLEGMLGLEAVPEVVDASPETAVVMYVDSVRDVDIDAALRLRVNGIVDKTSSLDELRKGIVRANAGKLFCCRATESRMRAKVKSSSGKVSRAATLTAREVTIARYLALGMSAKEVAAMLRLSPKTVDSHRTRIMAKLDVRDRVALSRFAVREGLVGL